MIQVLREYLDGDIQVTEYTQDGVNASHTVRVPIASTIEPQEPQEQQPTLEELQAQVLMNTEMLLIYSELGM